MFFPRRPGSASESVLLTRQRARAQPWATSRHRRLEVSRDCRRRLKVRSAFRLRSCVLSTVGATRIIGVAEGKMACFFVADVTCQVVSPHDARQCFFSDSEAIRRRTDAVPLTAPSTFSRTFVLGCLFVVVVVAVVEHSSGEGASTEPAARKQVVFTALTRKNGILRGGS